MNEDNHSVEENLIVKHLTGEASDAEENALKEWITMSKENELIYTKLKRAFELTGKHYNTHGYENIDVNEEIEWNRFVKTIDQRNEKSVHFVPERKQNNAWLRIAAAILLIVASGIVVNYFSSQSGNQIYVTAENTETVTLPDGSTVFLNRNSELAFKKSFGEKHRVVSLSGEGFFEVVPDSQSPFIIEIHQAEVTVLGTSFNIQSYIGRDELEVTVETGIVKFNPKMIDQDVELRAGEKGVFGIQTRKLVKDVNKDVNYIAWKTKRIVFDGNNLEEVAGVLRSVYGIEVVISENVSETCQVTVTFDNQSLDAVLNVLKSTLDLTYKMERNKIEITKAGC